MVIIIWIYAYVPFRYTCVTPFFLGVSYNISRFDKKRFTTFILFQIYPHFRRLIAVLSPRISDFGHSALRVGFVVDKVALGQFFLLVLQSSPVSIIPPMLHTHISPSTIAGIYCLTAPVYKMLKKQLHVLRKKIWQTKLLRYFRRILCFLTIYSLVLWNKLRHLFVISGFRRDVNEIFALLVCYAA